MKKLVAALAATLVVVSIFAVDRWRELYEVRMQITQLRERVARLQSAQLTAALTPGVPASAPALAAEAASTSTSQARPVAPEPAVAGARNKGTNDALLEMVRQTMAGPEGRELMLSQARMFLPRMYPDLGRELGLTTAEVDKLFELLARQQMDTAMDSQGMLTDEPRDPDAAREMQRKSRERQQANQAELTAMLGSKYPQWQEYQKTLPIRQQVTQLQSALGGDNSLSDAQSRTLITALAAEQARIQEDRRNAPRPAAGNLQYSPQDELKREVENNQRLISAAASHLTPQQLEGYRRMLARQEEMARTVMRSMMPQGNGGDQAPALPR